MGSRLFKLFKRRNSSEKSNHESQEEIKVPEAPYVAASLFYLFVVIFIGVPIWLLTCSNTRYSLPDLSQLDARLNNPQQPIKLNIEISLVQLPVFGSLSSNQDYNLSTNQLTHFLRANLPDHLDTSVDNVVYDLAWRVRRPTQDEYRLFQDHQQQPKGTEFQAKFKAIRELESLLIKLYKPTNRFKLFIFYIQQQHHQDFCDTSRWSYLLSFERFVYICTPIATTESDYKSILNLTLDALKEVYYSTVDIENSQHLIQGKLDLLFSLISESSIQLPQLASLATKIHSIYDKNVLRKYPELKELVNILPITQQLVDVLDDELLHNILEPPKLDSNHSNVDNNSSQPLPSRIIKTSQMSQLFHKFESRLSKHSSQNVYNALLIIPDPSKQTILYDTSLSDPILPMLQTQQSSSLLIVNDDKTLVLGMRTLMRKLIGLSTVNLCEHCLIYRDVFFNRHELDAMMGVLTIIKLNKVFISIKSMHEQMIGLKISSEVSRMAFEAHRLALDSIKHLRAKLPVEAYRDAKKAFELSELAYYDPSLIDSSYFPDELKYAIYTPLFLPLAPAFISSFIGVVKYFLQQRRKCN